MVFTLKLYSYNSNFYRCIDNERLEGISQEALHDKPLVFTQFRERHKETTLAYEEIKKQSRDLKLH